MIVSRFVQGVVGCACGSAVCVVCGDKSLAGGGAVHAAGWCLRAQPHSSPLEAGCHTFPMHTQRPRHMRLRPRRLLHNLLARYFVGCHQVCSGGVGHSWEVPCAHASDRWGGTADAASGQICVQVTVGSNTACQVLSDVCQSVASQPLNRELHGAPGVFDCGRGFDSCGKWAVLRSQ